MGAFKDSLYCVIVVEFLTKVVEVENGVRVKAQIWDTAGQERFHSMMATYYKRVRLARSSFAKFAAFNCVVAGKGRHPSLRPGGRRVFLSDRPMAERVERAGVGFVHAMYCDFSFHDFYLFASRPMLI